MLQKRLGYWCVLAVAPITGTAEGRFVERPVGSVCCQVPLAPVYWPVPAQAQVGSDHRGMLTRTCRPPGGTAVVREVHTLSYPTRYLEPIQACKGHYLL